VSSPDSLGSRNLPGARRSAESENRLEKTRHSGVLLDEPRRLKSQRRKKPELNDQEDIWQFMRKTGPGIMSSNTPTISPITVAMPGTRSSANPGRSCPPHPSFGRPWVTQCEDWYKIPVETSTEQLQDATYTLAGGCASGVAEPFAGPEPFLTRSIGGPDSRKETLDQTEEG
jgi:hypothetical protein